MMFFLTNPKLLNTVLANIGAIKGTSCEKLYQELGLEYLQQRRWMRHLHLFYKVVSGKLPAYIYDSIPPARQSQIHPNTFKFFSFKNTFFLVLSVNEIRILKFIVLAGTIYYNIFRKFLLNFIRPSFFYFFRFPYLIAIYYIGFSCTFV